MSSQDITLKVLENGKPLSFTLADITLYHGFGFPGGVAHAFKVMELALPLLGDDGPPERREIAIATPFRGPGGRDAFEMVTRCVSDGRYTIDPNLIKTERGEVLKGYVFNLTYRERTLFLQIKEDHVREEFILLGRKPGRTDAEEEHLTQMKQEMAGRLFALPAADVYEVLSPA